MELEFYTCSEGRADWLYSHHDGSFFLKLKSGDCVVAELNWRQGRHNNYYFYSEYFGREIPLDDVKEVASIPEED